MKIKFKKTHKLAKAPVRAYDWDAGWDLVATTQTYGSEDESGLYMEYGTGLCLEIPKGYVGLVFPRSSISLTRHMLRNSVAVIDSGYRGEIKLRFSNDFNTTTYVVGDKIAQIIFLRLPQIAMEEVKSLTESDRGSDGFGSTGT